MTEPITAIDEILKVFSGIANVIGNTGSEIKILFETNPWFSGITAVFSFIGTVIGLLENKPLLTITTGIICLLAIIIFITTVFI